MLCLSLYVIYSSVLQLELLTCLFHRAFIPYLSFRQRSGSILQVSLAGSILILVVDWLRPFQRLQTPDFPTNTRGYGVAKADPS